MPLEILATPKCYDRICRKHEMEIFGGCWILLCLCWNITEMPLHSSIRNTKSILWKHKLHIVPYKLKWDAHCNIVSLCASPLIWAGTPNWPTDIISPRTDATPIATTLAHGVGVACAWACAAGLIWSGRFLGLWKLKLNCKIHDAMF